VRGLPLLARAFICLAKLLTPARDRFWVDAMRGDLDVAQTKGRAVAWALGCLIAAVRLRSAAMRERPAARSTVDECIVAGDRLIRGALLLFAVAVPLVVGSLIFRILVMSAGGRLWPALVTSLSSAPLPGVCSAVLGTLATGTTAIILCTNLRHLPPRLPRFLPYERRLVIFWGADRATMLARIDAGAPEMTLPRVWLVALTASSGFVLFENALQLLEVRSGPGLGVGFERLVTYGCIFGAVLCVANLLYVIAHVRFARSAASR